MLKTRVILKSLLGNASGHPFSITLYSDDITILWILQEYDKKIMPYLKKKYEFQINSGTKITETIAIS